MSLAARASMIKAKEYFGMGSKDDSKDESRVCELGIMLEMV